MQGPATILIMAKKKAAGPGGFFDPMGESAGMAMGPMETSEPGGMFDTAEGSAHETAEGENESLQMFQANLQSILSKTQSVYDMSEGCELPEWVKQKITVCDSYMDSVYDYLKFNPEYSAKDVPAEEAPPKMKRAPPAFLSRKPTGY